MTKRNYTKRNLPTRSCDDGKKYFQEYWTRVTKPKIEAKKAANYAAAIKALKQMEHSK